MTDPHAADVDCLRRAYAAFNSRDIDSAVALMTPDVNWPRAFQGGCVIGPEAIREYWTAQWGEIDGHVEPISFKADATGRIVVDVHQVVRDLTGTVLADEQVQHCFTMEYGRIRRMEIGES